MNEKLDRVLAALTPERLREIILAIASEQAPADRAGVALTPIIEALTGGNALGTGSEGWGAYLKLKEAIIQAVDQVAGMRYVEGDA